MKIKKKRKHDTHYNTRVPTINSLTCIAVIAYYTDQDELNYSPSNF